MKRFLHGYAISHDSTTAKLVRGILAEWVHERVGSTPGGRVDSTLHALKTLGMELQLKVLGQDERVYAVGEVRPIGAPKPPHVEVESEREVMYDLVVAMLKEAQRLAGNEELAKQSKARMTAMLVASNLARTGEAVLRGYEKGYLEPLVDELVNLIEQLKEQLEEARQTGQEGAPASAET